MVTDAKATGYTYSEAASVLRGLGFELAPGSGGSHRKWRGLSAGNLKAYLVRDMVCILREADMIPEGLESPDAMDH
jgi:hypothetical protein